jgi:GT2 family glycosyltransferase
MSPSPRVAAVVVSYESRETLPGCLDSLRRDGVPVETVVVDNASRDGSAESVRERFHDASVLANPENVGFARACNQGARATRAPLLLFLNPDATLDPGALAALAALFDGRPRLGIAGPRTLGAGGAVQVSTGPDLSLASEWRQRRLVRGVDGGAPRALAEAEALHSRERAADWVSGACLIVRREAFDAVSGFDESFFLYEEDADLCRRVRAAGYEVVFTPAAVVRHARGRSMERAPDQARLEYQRSHLRYYRKHAGPFARAALRTLLALRGAAGLVRGALTADPGRSRESLALLQLALAGR